MKNDPCRFCRLYALSLLPIAALLGALLTWQTAFALEHSELLRPPRQLESSEMLVRMLHAVAPGPDSRVSGNWAPAFWATLFFSSLTSLVTTVTPMVTLIAAEVLFVR